MPPAWLVCLLLSTLNVGELPLEPVLLLLKPVEPAVPALPVGDEVPPLPVAVPPLLPLLVLPPVTPEDRTPEESAPLLGAVPSVPVAVLSADSPMPVPVGLVASGAGSVVAVPVNELDSTASGAASRA